MSRVPAAIYSMGWNGTSECDYIVHAHRGYSWGDLRPLEQIRLSECVEQRELSHELNTLVGVNLPIDLFYNWKRKFEMGYHGAFGLLLYMQHWTVETFLATGLTSIAPLGHWKCDCPVYESWRMDCENERWVLCCRQWTVCRRPCTRCERLG